MAKRRIVLTAIGIVVLLTTTGVWLSERADAIIIINSRTIDTGMFGLIADQTARVHIVNASGFSADDQPCVVEVRFYDSMGNLLGQRQLKILPGHAGFADYAQKVQPGERTHLRAQVSQMLLGDFDVPVATCITTAEVFDNRTGEAGIIIIGGGHPVK
jgi:hypothetical protein